MKEAWLFRLRPGHNHQKDKGVPLAKRRFLEAQEAGKRFGVTHDVLDITTASYCLH